MWKIKEEGKNLEIIQFSDLVTLKGSYPINFNCMFDFVYGIENPLFSSASVYVKLKENKTLCWLLRNFDIYDIIRNK